MSEKDKVDKDIAQQVVSLVEENARLDKENKALQAKVVELRNQVRLADEHELVFKTVERCVVCKQVMPALSLNGTTCNNVKCREGLATYIATIKTLMDNR
ncbi:MAG: hypothetical protein WCW02_03540 [Candidatus Buchananbacteria bacterium]